MKNGLEWRILEKQRSVWKKKKGLKIWNGKKEYIMDVESIEFDKQVELRGNDWGNSKSFSSFSKSRGKYNGPEA